LPRTLQKKVAPAEPSGSWPTPRHSRAVLMLEGCVQPTLAPNINSATARVLDALGISILRVKDAGCCGALSYHLNYQAEGLDYARRNIVAWSPHLDGADAVESIVVNASGCGTMVHEYGHHLRLDPKYADRAAKVASRFRDVAQVVAAEIETLRKLIAHK